VTDQTHTEGDIVIFTCKATGDPIPNISWYFNDVPVNKSNKYQILTETLNYTTSESALTVKSLESTDVGTYTCYATNGVSADMSSGILSVTGKLTCLISACIVGNVKLHLSVKKVVPYSRKVWRG